MQTYKHWSPEERKRSLYYTNKAKRMGLMSPPSKCNRCGQTEGILHHHNDNYDWTLENLPEMLKDASTITEEDKVKIAGCCEEICWTCHMIHHKEHRNKEKHDEYFSMVKAGFMASPVFKGNDWARLKAYGF